MCVQVVSYSQKQNERMNECMDGWMGVEW